MLFVHVIENLSKDPVREENVRFVLPAPVALRPGERVAVFSGGDMILARITGINGISVTAEPAERAAVPDNLTRTLFRKKPFFFHPELFYRRVRALNAALVRGPALLHWKEKEGQYLRCVLADSLSSTFREKYLDWNEWSGAREEMERLRRDINRAVRTENPGELGRLRAAESAVLGGILEKMDLRRDLDIVAPDSVRLLTVFLEPGGMVPPFDGLSANLIVSFRISSEKAERPADPTASKAGMTLLYSESRPGTRPETALLADELKDSFAVDFYGDDRYEEFKPRLVESLALHYSGHGEIAENGGRIQIGGKACSGFCPYGSRLGLVFLNCCETGAVSGGIIGSIVSENGGFAVASPYEIPDGMTDHIRDFYRFLDLRDPEMTYRVLSVKDPSFSRWYRFFGPNRIKFD